MISSDMVYCITSYYIICYPQDQGPECDYGFKLIIIGDAGAGAARGPVRG